MVKLSWIFLLSVVAVFTVQLASCFTVSCIVISYPTVIIILAFTLKDLENSNNCFIPEAVNWYASESRSTIYTKCRDMYLLGGYGVLGNSATQYNAYFGRLYTGVPSHTMVYFTMRIWAIDNWQPGDIPFILQIDSRSFPLATSLASTSFPTNQCGTAGYNDLPDIWIFGRAFHQGSSISITLKSQFSQNSLSRSFGIRDVSLIFAMPSPSPSETMCGTASIAIGVGLQCPCPVGQYLSSSVSCVICHSSCASCFGPFSNQCYECKTGYYYNGINCNPCDASCSTCDGPSPSDCRSCRTGSYLFNNICVSCSPPLSIIPANGCIAAYCQNPCLIFDFLYWDQTCEASCPLPLQITTLQGLYPYTVKACTFPCSSDQYLFWDGTCKARCSLPLTSRVIKNVNFCEYLCNNHEYLYPNGSCISGCITPFVPVKYGGKNFCSQESKSSNPIMIFSIVGGGMGIILVIAVTIKFTKKRTLQVEPGQEKENLDNSAQALAVNQSSDLPPILTRIEFATIMQSQKVNEEEVDIKVDVSLNEQSIIH